MTYNAAISACGRGGEWQRGLSLVAEMRRKKLLPDHFTFGAAISACERSGRWEEALTLVGDMLLIKARKDGVCG